MNSCRFSSPPVTLDHCPMWWPWPTCSYFSLNQIKLLMLVTLQMPNGNVTAGYPVRQCVLEYFHCCRKFCWTEMPQPLTDRSIFLYWYPGGNIHTHGPECWPERAGLQHLCVYLDPATNHFTASDSTSSSMCPIREACTRYFNRGDMVETLEGNPEILAAGCSHS